MSRVPMGSDGGAWAMDPETNYATGFVPQGVGADLIATIEGFDRDDVDAYAARVARSAPPRPGPTGRFDRLRGAGAGPRSARSSWTATRPSGRGTTLESLAALEPVVRRDRRARRVRRGRAAALPLVERIEHVHTPATHRASSTAPRWSLVGSEAAGQRAGLTPRARVVAPAVTGAEPTIMLTGPAPAARKALAKAGLTIDDIDLFEVNEAFAAVPLRFMRDLGVRTGAGQRQRRRDRDGPPAWRDRRDAARHAAGRAGAPRAGATAWPRCASAAAWASRRSSNRVWERTMSISIRWDSRRATASSSSPSTTRASRRTP